MNRRLLLILALIPALMIAQVNPCAFDGLSQSRTVGFKEDRLPDNFDIGRPGDGNLWMFTTLQSATYHKHRLDKARSGNYEAFFPAAESVLLCHDGTEIYYKRQGSYWVAIGQAIAPATRGESAILKYQGSLVSCFPDRRNQSIESSVQFAWIDERSQEESNIRETHKDIRDASGMLYLPDGVYEADRITRDIEYYSDVDLPKRFALSPRRQYIFVDQITEEILMIVDMDQANQVRRVFYRSDKEIISRTISSNKGQFSLYPTTSFGEIRLDFNGFESGDYHFEVYNIIGKKLWSTRYRIDGNMTIKEDLTFLSKGSYLYTVLDEEGNAVVTRRLAIINP
ncbi:MAG: hypothetical protein AAFQ02_09615 [Bacteroidota bacterium]